MMFVDSVLMVIDGGDEAKELLSMIDDKGMVNLAALVQSPAGAGVDWNEVLRTGHLWYDKLAKSMRLPSSAERRAALTAINAELDALQAPTKQRLAALTAQNASAEETTKVVSDVLVLLLLPSATGMQNAEDRAEQAGRNLDIAFALAAFRAERKEYPPQLADLSPKYLAAVPDDIFASAPLHYERTAAGYRLWSVGPDGQDNSGHNYDVDPPADDIGFQLPPPPAAAP
jgi:hypothetical protein